jgi:hypothetical protein
LPSYPIGTCIIVPLGELGIDNAFFPICAAQYSPVVLTLCKKTIKIEKDEDGNDQENIFLNLQFTIDHRYMDGAVGAKINTDVFIYYNLN